MSSAGTVNGRGFVISYSVESGRGPEGVVIGGYKVTVDSTVLATCTPQGNDYGGLESKTANGSHLFFTSKIALAFTKITSGNNYYSSTGSGNMKYILGSWL